MDDKIIEFVEMLCDNNVQIKKYDLFPLNYDYENDLLETDWEAAIIGDVKLNSARFYLYLKRLETKEKEKVTILNDITTTRYYLNGYWKQRDFFDYIQLKFEDFKVLIANCDLIEDQKDINDFQNAIWHSIEELTLYPIVTHHELRDINSMLKVKIDCCQNVIVLLRNLQSNISSPDKAKQSKRWKEHKKLTKLSQNQIAILFHFMRDLELIGNGMQKKEYAEIISSLTGFSSEKIRQKLSHIEKQSNSVESDQFKEVDFSITRRVFENIIAEIRTYTEQKIF